MLNALDVESPYSLLGCSLSGISSALSWTGWKRKSWLYFWLMSLVKGVNWEFVDFRHRLLARCLICQSCIHSHSCLCGTISFESETPYDRRLCYSGYQPSGKMLYFKKEIMVPSFEPVKVFTNLNHLKQNTENFPSLNYEMITLEQTIKENLRLSSKSLHVQGNFWSINWRNFYIWPNLKFDCNFHLPWWEL